MGYRHIYLYLTNNLFFLCVRVQNWDIWYTLKMNFARGNADESLDMGGSLFWTKPCGEIWRFNHHQYIVDTTIYIYIYLGCDFRHVLIISVRFGMKSAMNWNNSLIFRELARIRFLVIGGIFRWNWTFEWEYYGETCCHLVVWTQKRAI